MLLAWMVVLLLWGLLHWWIVPRAEDLRPWVQEQASALVGTAVQIESMQAQSTGLVPALVLRNVRVLDAQGQDAVVLEKVQVALSPRSLLAGGFEQLHVQSPQLLLRRDAQGTLFVGGLPLPDDDGKPSALLDWVFSQPEIALVGGVVRWVDEMRAAPPLEWRGVDVVVRNRLFTHALRLDATAVVGAGLRVQLQGRFKEPVLSLHAGNWRAWRGTAYVEAPQWDWSLLGAHVDMPVAVQAGMGSVRAWVGLDQARVVDATMDVALQDLAVRWRDDLDPVQLHSAAGRLGWETTADRRTLWTQGLQWATADGLRWPGGNVSWTQTTPAAGGLPEHRVQADRLDLAALAQVLERLPLPEAVRQQLVGAQLRGLVPTVQAQWRGQALQDWQDYRVQAQVQGLAFAPQGARPGVSGVDADISLEPGQGQAEIKLAHGGVDAPAVFDEGFVPLDQLKGELRWRQQGARWDLELRKWTFANADAQGELEAKWHNDLGQDRAGVLDLRATLSRADVARVHRYLPTEMDPHVREYLRHALVAGQASQARFRVKGPLKDFPFEAAGSGEFSVSAQVRNGQFTYAPPMVQAPGDAPWPGLGNLSCDFTLDASQLRLRNVRAALVGAPSLVLNKAEASISDVYHKAQLQVSAEARLGVAEGLAWVRSTPLSAMLGHALDEASGTGAADLRLKLGLPLSGEMIASVQGQLQLLGGDLDLGSPLPRLEKVRGQLQFTQSMLSIAPTQARAMGGEVRVEGSLGPWGNATSVRSVPTQLRIQGNATVDGLRQAAQWPWLEPLLPYVNGGTHYSATVSLREGQPEIQLRSNLSGLALSLPQPLNKEADALWPVRLQNRVLPGTGGGAPGLEQWELEVDGLGAATYVVDGTGRVVRGALGLGLGGDESAPLPAQGVVANVRLAQLDVDAWTKLLGGGASANAGSGQDFMPTSAALRVGALQWDGRRFNNIVVGASREGAVWRANMDAAEFSGYTEYRPSQGSQAGRLYARLARLVVAQNDAQDVEDRLDEQPASIPALDIVVEDFELRGRKLGRLDIDAVNVGAGAAREAAREWRLNRFNLSMPEATLTAQGAWVPVAGATAVRSARERRRTTLDFKLEVQDAGELLARFGMKDVMRKGQGRFQGQIGWLGSPITLDYKSLGGQANLNIENGQFLKADPGLAKLLGVLSLQSLPRRLTLDFRDVFSEGFSYDFVRGDVSVDQGVARTNNLQMKGVSAAVLMEGQADLEKETQALKVVVVPEINAGSASLIASAINPMVGLTTFLAQWILRRPLSEATTQEFFIDGTWLEPQVTRVPARSGSEPKP